MYICSSHCPPNDLHAITSMHECTPLECGDTDKGPKALQLTISKDRRGIGVASHMGRGFLLFQGRLTFGLHCMVEPRSQGVKQWQCTHTLAWFPNAS